MNSKHKPSLRAAFSSGFTLLEVMVSVSIIAIVLVSIIRLQGQSIAMNESIRFYTVAPLLAEEKVAEIKSKPADFKLSASGDFGEEFPGYSWKAEMEDLKIEVMDSPELNLTKIDLEILFNDGGLNFSIRHFLNTDSGAYDE